MADFEALFESEGFALEQRSWRELALFHNQVVDLFNRELDVITLIIATIVILGIAALILTISLSYYIERCKIRIDLSTGKSPHP
mgnify:CR=1 FL=1